LKRTLFALALAAALPLSANAATPSYTYVEANYLQMNAEDSAGPDIDTWTVQGSVDLGSSNSYLFGSYQDSSDYAHYNHFHEDFSVRKIGAGYHWALGDSTTLHVEAGGGTETMYEDDFYTVGLGVRHNFGDHFELSGNATQRFGSDGLKDTTFVEVAGQYKFNANWGLTAAYTWGDYDGGSAATWDSTYDSTYKFGVRYSF
jgi:hypothetical protein